MSLDKPKHILFILAQAGQAAFISPILEGWSYSLLANCSYSLLAGDAALSVLDEKVLEASSSIYQWENFHDFSHISDVDLVVSSATRDKNEVEASLFYSKRTVPLIQFVDTFYDVEARLNNSCGFDIQPSSIWVLDDAIIRNLHVNTAVAVGHPAWEKSLEKTYNQNRDGKIVFAAQPISELQGLSETLGYDEKTVWEQLCVIQDRHIERIPELIYAPHPAQKKLPDITGESRRFLKIDEDPILAGEIMIGMYSAIMIEAKLRGQKVISFQPNLICENKDYLSYSGLIPLIKCKSELDNEIKNISSDVNDDLKNLVKDSCERCVKDMISQLTGGSNV